MEEETTLGGGAGGGILTTRKGIFCPSLEAVVEGGTGIYLFAKTKYNTGVGIVISILSCGCLLE